MSDESAWGNTTAKAFRQAEHALGRMWRAGIWLADELAWAQSVADEANALADLQRERAEGAERERDEALTGKRLLMAWIEENTS